MIKIQAIIIFVIDVPVVSLELGTNLNATNIREGMDVYFECRVKANPWVRKVIWLHDVCKLIST